MEWIATSLKTGVKITPTNKEDYIMDNKGTIKGMNTCEVCGRDFPLLIEEHYMAKDQELKGLASIAGGMEPRLWDAFDCPHCGCQNRVNPRMRLFCCDCECQTEDEEDE